MHDFKIIFKGRFIKDPDTIRQKLEGIKAYMFDWDGVFNNGHKTETGSSSFSEVDSMGTNLLRFSHYLKAGQTPNVAIVTGEQNKAAAYFAEREHFDTVYWGIRNKALALQHFCKEKSIKPEEVVYVFDDVLDFAAAPMCGLRIMIERRSNPLLMAYAEKHNMVDYFTHSDGSENAVREASELVMGLIGQYDAALEHRVSFSNTYLTYIEKRNYSVTKYYSANDLS
jgi:3-deoxy-D-manno-octulosonate 8-phosphate phosphatase (KDO 8-P phosphatase)